MTRVTDGFAARLAAMAFATHRARGRANERPHPPSFVPRHCAGHASCSHPHPIPVRGSIRIPIWGEDGAVVGVVTRSRRIADVLHS